MNASPLSKNSPIAPSVTVEGLCKQYGATIALEDVSFSVQEGEVHALIGENGAGKSTLVKILSGIVSPNNGRISILGEPVNLSDPKQAHASGVQTAFQELTLIEDLTVSQNMLIPYEPGPGFWVSAKMSKKRVEEGLASLDLGAIDPDALVSSLDLPTRQKLEIAKAILRNPRLLLLDEPTSTMSAEDVDWLDKQIKRLIVDGVSIVFISHRLVEVRRFCDSLTVLRNGKNVGSFSVSDVSDEQLVRLIIGRSLDAIYPKRIDTRRKNVLAPALEAKALSTGGLLQNVSFSLWPGEVLGISALQGMGQLELFEALFGVIEVQSGTIAVDGTPTKFATPIDAIRAGISLVPEDRKTEGLFLGLSGRDNASISVIDKLSRNGRIDFAQETCVVDEVFAQLNVHPRALYKAAGSFSGGNQQKIAIAKWLLTGSQVLLMFDPTRGVDIGAKHEIYVLIRELAAKGHSVLYYSSEVPELVNVCDRVLAMYNGRLVAELGSTAISEEAIMAHVLGVSGDTQPETKSEEGHNE